MMNKIWKLFICITGVKVLHLNTLGVINRFELIKILCENKYN